MAIPFLTYSRTYLEKVSEVFRFRRTLVAEHADENYEIKAGLWTSVVGEKFVKAGYNLGNRHRLVDDLYMYRKVFLWLCATQEIKEYLATRFSPSITLAIRCLKTDGINSFADLPVDAPAYETISEQWKVERDYQVVYTRRGGKVNYAGTSKKINRTTHSFALMNENAVLRLENQQLRSRLEKIKQACAVFNEELDGLL